MGSLKDIHSLIWWQNKIYVYILCLWLRFQKFTEWLFSGRVLLESSLTSQLKQGHLVLDTQDHFQRNFEYPHVFNGFQRFHSFFGQPVSVISHLHNVSWHSDESVICFCLCSLPLEEEEVPLHEAPGLPMDWCAVTPTDLGSGWHPPRGPWPMNANQRTWSTCCSWPAGLQQAPITTSTLSILAQEIQVALH